MSQPQTNGVAPSSSASQTQAQFGASQASSQPTQQTAPTTAPSQPPQPPSQQQQPQQPSPAPLQPATIQQQQSNTIPPPATPSASAPRPRDARTIELLLTAQGVTAYEQRVPLFLLDFAYRHTSAVLSDALHLSADPYTSHAGARPSAASGAAPVNAGDAAVSANAIQLAIASRLGFQFRGGSGGGGASKEWMMELAKERNRVALPRPTANEWGTRLPGEKFVMNGLSWGLRDIWAGEVEGVGGSDEEDEDEEMDFGGMGEGGGGGDAMEIEKEDIGGDGVEGGTVDDVFGDDDLEDEEMVEV